MSIAPKAAQGYPAAWSPGWWLGCLLMWLSGPAVAQASDLAALREEVRQTEIAFAATMADRDHDAFIRFLADEAIFFAGDQPIRGSAAVAGAWAPFFEGPDPPFSWAPDLVEVLDSGTLAISSGPVYDQAGQVTARFQSIWRRDAAGQWRVVFDRGSPVCRPCDTAAPPEAQPD